jgi:hypothetical protein
MNIVLYAGEAKGVSSLLPICREAERSNINFWALFSNETELQFPHKDKDKFNIISNVPPQDSYWSHGLGCYLPFKPDYFLIQRAQWEPESSLVREFKSSFNCKVGLVEQNAQCITNIETVLETFNKNKFTPFIDFFFDHSEWVAETRRFNNFNGNIIITGNPKYDLNLQVQEEELDSLRSKYKISPDRKNVLITSIITHTRPAFFSKIEEFINDHPDYNFFIKPYPGEPFVAQFKNQYRPKFFIPGVTPILEELDIWGMFHLCDLHIGCGGSISYSSILLGKEYIDLSVSLGIPQAHFNFDPYLNSTGIGVEDKAALWVGSMPLNHISDIKEMIPPAYVKEACKRNQIYQEAFAAYTAHPTPATRSSLLIFFDSFNDHEAAKRILSSLIRDELSEK